MKNLTFLNRLLYIPFGLLKGIFYLANERARDKQNKVRFPKAIIEDGCHISKDTLIGERSHVLKGCTINHSKIGSYTYININSMIQNTTIGNYCSIAQNVLTGLGAHPLDLFSSSPVFYKVKNTLNIPLVKNDLIFSEYEPINIGHDVWIGANAIIMDGVSVGNGAVIAAGAVVTKDVPHYAIVGGIPAKIIKYRFSDKTISDLLRTKWWEKKPFEIYKDKGRLENICLKN